MLVNDAVDDGQPQAGPLALDLGGEIGLEYLAQHAGVDATARVRDAQLNIAAGFEGAARPRIIGQRSLLQRNPDLARVRLDGVVGVGHQVHDDLVHLGRIGHHRAAVLLDVREYGNIRRNRGDAQPEGFPEDFLDVERQPLLLGLAAEGQDLLDEIAAAFAGLEDSPGIFAFEAFGGQILHQHFRQSDDREKNVVEIVGDAAGQIPDGFHLLGLEKARFDGFAFGHVLVDAVDFNGVAGGVLLHKEEHGNMADRSVGIQDAMLNPAFEIRGCRGNRP